MIEDYRKARKRGLREVNRDVAEGRNPFPTALDDLVGGRPFARETNVGTCEIPLDLVVGTKVRGRANLFSAGFMPLADEGTEFAAKWSHLYDAQVAEGFRDPIVVYEFLQRFYVQEGNKRVSVARYLQAPTIMASVTRALPLAGMGLDEELDRYREFERFFGVVPLYDLSFSHAGDYRRLARALGHDLDTAWSEEDVRRLRAVFWAFRSAYVHLGGNGIACSDSDAFLLYVQTYGCPDALDMTSATMASRVKSMWSEFVTASQPNPIAFVGEPASKAKDAVVKGRVLHAPRAKPLRVAFVYDHSAATSGWTLLHDRGRLDLQRRMGGEVLTYAYDNCATDVAFDQAVASAQADGCTVVVTTSPRQMDQVRRAAATYPKLRFYNCSINISSSVVRCFYARMYEVKFVMGALAASLSQSHQLGYLATSPMQGTLAEVNAFALGASMVDPYATVHLTWRATAGTWQDELRAAGVDVLAGMDYPNPARQNELYGLYALHEGTAQHVATPVWDWGTYYEYMMRAGSLGETRAEQRLSKTHAVNYWWGMRAGVVRLELDAGVAQGSKRLVDLMQRALLSGEFAPFDTVLLDQQANVVRSADDPPLTDDKIASMSWLNINVAGSLPTMMELTDAGRANVEASGVVAWEREV